MLAPSDLGVEFSTVQCSIGEDVRGCPYRVDAAAAFMPAGTRMYAVRGYATEFRLAAVGKDRIFLYQLMGGVVGPGGFRRILERYLGE